MLLALMYHRAELGPRIDKYANSREMLSEHFLFLKEHYPLVLPGDSLPKRKLAVCVTFDDATFDFYHYIFPIIKELEMRVVLGVPVHYILDATTVEAEERLKIPYSLMMQEGFYDQKAPFCTWQELDEMVSSGFVEVASHSYSHCNLTFNFVDLNREVVRSKEIIEQKLAQPVSTFIYPFGKVTIALHEYVAQHYPYAFRIGSALNFGWGRSKKPLNRVSADNLPNSAAPLSFFRLAKAFAKAIVN
jgi:peptidoglycan/xylan/chitin deacetylase (PgdA/CDA1 family)